MSAGRSHRRPPSCDPSGLCGISTPGLFHVKTEILGSPKNNQHHEETWVNSDLEHFLTQLAWTCLHVSTEESPRKGMRLF